MAFLYHPCGPPLDASTPQTSGIPNAFAASSDATHDEGIAHQHRKIGTQDDNCIPQVSIAIIDLLDDDGPCEAFTHKGLVGSWNILGQV